MKTTPITQPSMQRDIFSISNDSSNNKWLPASGSTVEPKIGKDFFKQAPNIKSSVPLNSTSAPAQNPATSSPPAKTQLQLEENQLDVRSILLGAGLGLLGGACGIAVAAGATVHPAVGVMLGTVFGAVAGALIGSPLGDGKGGEGLVYLAAGLGIGAIVGAAVGGFAGVTGVAAHCIFGVAGAVAGAILGGNIPRG